MSHTQNKIKMKKYFLISQVVSLLFLSPVFANAQEKALLKTNLLGWSMANLNIGLEFPVSPYVSVGLGGSYNPWQYMSSQRLQHLILRPEARYYPCRVFRKYFFGLQGLYGVFNAGGLNIPFFSLKEKRYIGTLWGTSVIGGYQFPIGKHWSFESLIGIGYIDTRGKLYELPRCGNLIGRKTTSYLGITDVALSFIYVFN